MVFPGRPALVNQTLPISLSGSTEHERTEKMNDEDDDEAIRKYFEEPDSSSDDSSSDAKAKPDSEASPEQEPAQLHELPAYEEIAREIRSIRGNSVRAIIQTALVCKKYEHLLGSQWAVVKGLLGHSDTWFSMQVAIAEQAACRFSEPATVDCLPASLFSLYELARLPEYIFNAALVQGVIRPDVTRAEVLSLKLKRPKAQTEVEKMYTLVAESHLSDDQKDEFDRLLNELCSPFGIQPVKTKKRSNLNEEQAPRLGSSRLGDERTSA